MPRRYRVAVIFLGGVLGVLAACGSKGGTAATESGVEGRTMVDSGCPILRPEPPCRALPLPARVEITSSTATKPVATVESNEDGHFRVALAPGTYTLTATNLTQAPVPRASSKQATVQRGQFVDVTIVFDSGIRRPGSP